MLQTQTNVDESVSKQIEEKPIVESTNQEVVKTSRFLHDYNLIYSSVRRGEVYWCDLGEPYGSEQGGVIPVIVIQNDKANLHSPTTIVLCCTSQHKKLLPTDCDISFSDDNMSDYEGSHSEFKQNVDVAEQIKTVDKTRLRKFIGTIPFSSTDELQEIIDISLQLKRTEEVITKTEKVYTNASIDPDAPKESKDLNMVQMQLLAMVNTEELFKISQTKVSDEIKSEKILQLFGFDMRKNGVQYLFKAILISPKHDYFNLETLCESISKNEPDIEKDEIKKLIVARVKEQFKFKKSPAIDFIRLVNSFLAKKETGKKVSDAENALLEVLGFAFDKLDPTKNVEEQINSFLTDIGMLTNERMVNQSFVIACDINKITYENVIRGLHKVNPKLNENIIKAILKENFKEWLKQYPELAKKCPMISLMSILKLFAKRLV